MKVNPEQGRTVKTTLVEEGQSVQEGDPLFVYDKSGEKREAFRDCAQPCASAEEAVRAGKVRSIGLSNFPARKIEQIMEVAQIKPAALQVELNPYWNQHALKAELGKMDLEDVVLEGWYPFGHGDAKLLAEPVIAKIAEAHGKTVTRVILRWMLQEGVVTFPKTTNPQHVLDNIDVFDFELSDDEMARINALPQKAYYDVPEKAPDFVLVQNDYSKQA